MSTLSLLTFLVLSLLNHGNGHRCPSSQNTEPHIICQIFAKTNIETGIRHTFASHNYCQLGYIEPLNESKSSTKHVNDSVYFGYLDEYDTFDIVSAKKNHLAQFKQKPFLSKTVQFSDSLSDKPC
eukprot:143224_1